MPTPTGFNRPNLQELLDRARSEYSSRIPGGDGFLDQGVLPRLADMDAASAHALHAHLDWASRQAMPLFAETEWLEYWGSLWGVARKPAVAATGDLTFTGADGTVLPAGVKVKRMDGELYTITVGGVVAAGVVAATVQADTPGVAANAIAATTINLVSPVAGLDSAAVVDGQGLTGGADAEADGAPGIQENYRGRILDRIQAPPHGGNGEDYRQWALQVPGVTRAWVAPLEMGIGTVTVRFMMDDTYADGIPLGNGAPTYSGDLLAVSDYINQHVDPATGETVGRPVTAEVFTVAPVAVPLDITITGLSPDTAAIRTEIEAELKDMIFRRATPGATIRQSWIWEAASIASGEDGHEITVPAADVAHTAGQIATLGTVTYA